MALPGTGPNWSRKMKKKIEPLPVPSRRKRCSKKNAPPTKADCITPSGWLPDTQVHAVNFDDANKNMKELFGNSYFLFRPSEKEQWRTPCCACVTCVKMDKTRHITIKMRSCCPSNTCTCESVIRTYQKRSSQCVVSGYAIQHTPFSSCVTPASHTSQCEKLAKCVPSPGYDIPTLQRLSDRPSRRPASACGIAGRSLCGFPALPAAVASAAVLGLIPFCITVALSFPCFFRLFVVVLPLIPSFAARPGRGCCRGSRVTWSGCACPGPGILSFCLGSRCEHDLFRLESLPAIGDNFVCFVPARSDFVDQAVHGGRERVQLRPHVGQALCHGHDLGVRSFAVTFDLPFESSLSLSLNFSCPSAV